jgi:hypothetical protein
VSVMTKLNPRDGPLLWLISLLLCADNAGAIYVFGSLSLSGCSFTRNNAGAFGSGGAVYVTLLAPGAIKSTTFVNNTAGTDGAGLLVDSSNKAVLTVSGSSFEGNAAMFKGGGIATHFASGLALSYDTTFSGNSAAADPTTADVFYYED